MDVQNAYEKEVNKDARIDYGYVCWLENKIMELSAEQPEKIKVQVQRKINGTNQTIVREVKMTQEEWDELYKLTSEVNERGW